MEMVQDFAVGVVFGVVFGIYGVVIFVGCAAITSAVCEVVAAAVKRFTTTDPNGPFVD